jgi:membrane protein
VPPPPTGEHPAEVTGRASRPARPPAPARAPGFGARVKHFFEVVVERAREPQQQIRRGLAFPYYLLRVLVQTVRQWARDRCPQQAASLAFQTALSIVPMIAIALAILRAAGEFEVESALVDFISREVLPQFSRGEIAGHLLSFAGNMSFATAGIAGVGSTLFLSFVMYASVEKIFNDVWKIERRRSLGQKFFVFYAVATLVPALIGVSLYHATRYGLTQGALGWLGALGATFGALFLANKLLPATHVKWRAAATGALFSSIAFEIAKRGFQLYVARVAFQSYAGVYGALGLVPILLLWIYYSWLVVLFGAEVAHTVQNLHLLEGLGRRSSDSQGAQVSGPIGARLLCAIVDVWRRDGRAVDRTELTARFGLNDDVAERVLARLREGGLVLAVDGDTTGYLPARAPQDITLGDVLDLFRGGDVAVRPTGTARLDEVLGELERTTRDASRAVTIEELSR